MWQTLDGQFPSLSSTNEDDRSLVAPGTIRRNIGDASIPVGAIQPCERCGETLERRSTPPNATGHVLYYWSMCRCVRDNDAAQRAVVAAAQRRQYERDEALLGDPGAKRIQRFQLSTFDPNLLTAETPAQHPYTVVTEWLVSVLQNEQDIATALYLYSPGKGRGKTHLAAALYWEVRNLHHRRVAFVEELSYLSLAWNTPFGPGKEALIQLPAEDAWFTVFDDMGRRTPGENPAGVQNAWSDLIGRRYLAAKPTIFTSNYMPEELFKRKTIDEASLSRICEMTRNRLVFFDGHDVRLGFAKPEGAT